MKLPDKRTIGFKIRMPRLESGLTQVELACLCLLKQKSISKYESNSVLPELKSLSKIAQVLKKDICYFLSDYQADF